MRKLTREQFAALANQQIANAIAMRRDHLPRPGGYCSCGKQTPCSVDQACLSAVTHFEAKLALLDATRAWPTVGEREQDALDRLPRWRLLIAAVLL